MADDEHKGDEEFKKFLQNQPAPLNVPDFVVRASNDKLDRLTVLLKNTVDGAKDMAEGSMKNSLVAFSDKIMDEIIKSVGMYSLIMFRELDGGDIIPEEGGTDEA